jgi:hypothetical protein
MRSLLTALIIMSGIAAGAQTLAVHPDRESDPDKAALARVKASMRQYLEDITERDLVVKETITSTDASGRVLKVEHRNRTSKGTSLKKNGGILAPSMRTQADMHFFFSPGPLFFFEIAHDGALLPIAVLFTSEGLAATGEEAPAPPAPSGGGPAALNQRLHAHWESRENCPQFDTNKHHVHVEYCGSGDMTFDLAGTPLSATFTSSKVPFELKDHTWLIKSWKFEETFQSVVIPETSTTVILPLVLRSIYETDKGNIVIENTYALAPAKK